LTDEIKRDGLPTRLIGFMGGEPFINAAFPAMLEETLVRGFKTLTLSKRHAADDALEAAHRDIRLEIWRAEARARLAR
jgi:hypothetical protein